MPTGYIGGCYNQYEPSTCLCKLCNNPIFGKIHRFTCKAMQPGNERENVLRLLHSSIDPTLIDSCMLCDINILTRAFINVQSLNSVIDMFF